MTVMLKNPKPVSTWKHWVKFFSEDIWHFDFSELTRVRKSIYQTVQVVLLVGERFWKDRLTLRASAMTYSTLLSIVPLLAFMFSVLKGMGVQRRLEPILLERVAAGSQETVAQLMHYIDKVNVGSLGALGLVLLILSVILVLDNVENAFNDIWGITVRRSYSRKVSDYLALVVVTPVFLLLALSVTATLKSMTVVTWLKLQPGLGPLVVLGLRLVPYAAVWLALTFLFIFLPNTRVRFTPALVAGVFTGTLWQLTQWFYITFQVGVARYNAIYGTFAQLPVMLVWIYISWIIVLFGAELTFALQNVHLYRRERKSGEMTFPARVETAWLFLREAFRRFEQGEAPWGAEAFSKHHRVPLKQASLLLEELTRLGYLARVGSDAQGAFLPAQDFRLVLAVDILEKLENAKPEAQGEGGEHARAGGADPAEPVERTWTRAVRQARRRALDGVMLVGPAPKP